VRLLLLLLWLLLSLLGRGRLLVVVVIVVALKKFLAQLFLSFMNVLVQLIAIFTDRKFLIVVYRNHDLLFAIWLVLRGVKLCNVRMCQGLLSSQPFVRVEVKKIFEQIESVFRCCREYVPQASCFSRRKTLKHGLSKRALNSFNVFGTRSPSNLQNSVELI